MTFSKEHGCVFQISWAHTILKNRKGLKKQAHNNDFYLTAACFFPFISQESSKLMNATLSLTVF